MGMDKTDAHRAWLAALTNGDPVRVTPSRGLSFDSTVARVTKTQIVIANGGRFNRAHGTSVGTRVVGGSDNLSPVQ